MDTRMPYVALFVLMLTASARAQDRVNIMYERPIASGPTYGQLVEQFFAAVVFPERVEYRGFGFVRDTCIAEMVETNGRGGYWLRVRARYKPLVGGFAAPGAETSKVHYDNGGLRVDLTEGVSGVINTRAVGEWVSDVLPRSRPGGTNPGGNEESFYGVVNITAGYTGIDVVRFQVRWRVGDTWLDWSPMYSIEDLRGRYFYQKGATRFQVRFDSSKEPGFQAKEYTLLFNMIPSSETPSADNAEHYRYKWIRANELDIVREQQTDSDQSGSDRLSRVEHRVHYSLGPNSGPYWIVVFARVNKQDEDDPEGVQYQAGMQYVEPGQTGVWTIPSEYGGIQTFGSIRNDRAKCRIGLSFYRDRRLRDNVARLGLSQNPPATVEFRRSVASDSSIDWYAN